MAFSFFKWFLFFAFAAFSLDGYAQNHTVDSLLEVLPHTTDTTRFNTLSKLFWNTFSTDPRLAKTYIDEERQLAKEMDLELFKGRSYNDLGVYYWTQSQQDSSILAFKKALEIFEKTGNKHRENATLNNLGNLYADQGDYEESLKYYLKSIKIKDELNDQKGLATTYTNIASIYIASNSLDLALEYSNKSLQIALSLNDSATISNCYSGIGTVYFTRNDFRKSISYRLKSLAITRKMNNRYGEALHLENLGQSYNKLGEYDSALICLKQALQINTEMGNRLAVSINCRSMGIACKGKRMYAPAYDFLKKSLAIAMELKAMPEIVNGYRVLAEIDEDKGNFASALNFYKKFEALQDSILSEDTKVKIHDLELKYQSEKKEKEIAQQNLEIETLKKAALVEDFKRKGLLAGLIAALLLGGSMVYSQKQRMRRHRLESEKRQMEIENELTLRKKELTTHTLHLVQKNELLDDINLKLKELKKSPEIHQKEITRIIQRIKNDKVADMDWDNFKIYFDQVHEDFDKKLKEYFNDLTTNEIRLAALMKMKLSTKEIASILNISPDSVNKARYRLRKKLNMASDDRLQDFILAL